MSRFKVGDIVEHNATANPRYCIINLIDGKLIWGYWHDNIMDIYDKSVGTTFTESEHCKCALYALSPLWKKLEGISPDGDNTDFKKDIK